jgi:hypothetical protein
MTLEKITHWRKNVHGRIRQVMKDSRIDGDFLDGIWTENAAIAMYDDKMIMNREKKKSAMEYMFGERAKGLKNCNKKTC